MNAAKAALRMFDVFRGPHFTLLTIGAAPPPRLEPYSHAVRGVRIVGKGVEAEEDALVDIDGFVERIYGAGTILVRPDGYVGYAGPEHAPRLNEYLGQFFSQ